MKHLKHCSLSLYVLTFFFVTLLTMNQSHAGGTYEVLPPPSYSYDNYESTTNNTYVYEPQYVYQEPERQSHGMFGIGVQIGSGSGYGYGANRAMFPAGAAMGSFRAIQGTCAQSYSGGCRPPIQQYAPQQQMMYQRGVASQGACMTGTCGGCMAGGCPIAVNSGPTVINLASRNAWEIEYTPPSLYLDMSMFSYKFPEPRQPTIIPLPDFGQTGGDRYINTIYRPDLTNTGVGHIPQLR